MYNVRVKKFLNTEQIQIFSKPVTMREETGQRKLIDLFTNMECDVPNFDRDTGEIFPRNRKLWVNIFTGELEPVCNLGNEEENIKRSVRRTKSKIYDIAKSNKWEWFVTFTFNPEKVDSFDYDIVTKKLSQWLKNIKRKNENMKYLLVPEQHESGRWHFHGLFEKMENIVFVDSGKHDNKGRVIYNVGSYKLGFSTATKISDLERACSYITKYTTKELCVVTKGKKRYWHSKNVEMPVIEEYFLTMSESSIIENIKGVKYMSKSYNEYNEVVYIETGKGATDFESLIYSKNSCFSNR